MYLRRMQNKVNKAAVVTTISHYVADVIRQHVDLNGKETGRFDMADVIG